MKKILIGLSLIVAFFCLGMKAPPHWGDDILAGKVKHIIREHYSLNRLKTKEIRKTENWTFSKNGHITEYKSFLRNKKIIVQAKYLRKKKLDIIKLYWKSRTLPTVTKIRYLNKHIFKKFSYTEKGKLRSKEEYFIKITN